MKNFDVFAGIDWSGAKSPINTKSIALAVAKRNNNAPELIDRIRSRQAVYDWVSSQIESAQRTLIGIDCNFGYAANIVKKHAGEEASAPNLWQAVDQANDNQPNFFAGGFWSHPLYKNDFWTAGKRPKIFSMPQRQTEKICILNGYGRPESPFKLIGAKQVGKGGLSGMRLAHALKRKYGHKISIWPFDNYVDEATVVMTEIYPRQFLMRAGHGTTKVRDIETLNTIFTFFGSKPYPDNNVTDHDTDALVSAAGLRYLCGEKANIPSSFSVPLMMNEDARKYEGWIFGVGDKQI